MAQAPLTASPAAPPMSSTSKLVLFAVADHTDDSSPPLCACAFASGKVLPAQEVIVKPHSCCLGPSAWLVQKVSGLQPSLLHPELVTMIWRLLRQNSDAEPCHEGATAMSLPDLQYVATPLSDEHGLTQ